MSNTLLKLPIGDKAPDVVNAVIEIPRDSQNKYEFDEKLGVFKLDRVGYSALRYPTDYGFIPETRSEDGDHLDVMVVGGDPVFSGCVVDARPIALLRMVDSGDNDEKILAVQDKNPRFATVKDLKDIEAFNPHLLKEIVHFWEHYKELQNKEVKVLGWADAKAAKEEIQKSQERYKREG
jgi:inorganic pyrophosphatase